MKLATAIAAIILAVSFAGVAPAVAADQPAPRHKVKHTHHKRTPRVAGYTARGNYEHGDQYVPYVYKEGRNPNNSSFDARNFDERVFDGPYNSQR
jgi:hypothetical protein